MITDSGIEERATKRVALYARVSTLNHGQDPEVQLRELREFCQRRRFEIAVEYVDKGISGSRERRPALDQLMAICRKRLVDAVVVYRYDRFARSLRQLVLALEEFRSLGIDFISLHEGVDTQLWIQSYPHDPIPHGNLGVNFIDKSGLPSPILQ